MRDAPVTAFEHALGREQSQDAIERVCINAARRRKFRAGYGFLADMIGYSKIGNDMNASSYIARAGESCDGVVRLLTHADLQDASVIPGQGAVRVGPCAVCKG
ncbi:MAG: hypothetical protein NVSMB60_33960 [Mycobacterium sp.]